jgi:hypothetical protein
MVAKDSPPASAAFSMRRISSVVTTFMMTSPLVLRDIVHPLEPTVKTWMGLAGIAEVDWWAKSKTALGPGRLFCMA